MPSYQKHIVKDINTASYIIFIDPKSGIIRARNGLTGKIDYEDYDASTVIQYAIDKTYLSGGVVYITPGRYLVTQTIFLYPGVTLRGAIGWENFAYETKGLSTVLKATTSLNSSIIKILLHDSGISVLPVIRDLHIVGTQDASLPNQHGIEISDENGYVMDIVIDHVYIHKASGYGLYVHDTDGKVWASDLYVENCVIDGVHIENPSLLRVNHLYTFGNQRYGVFVKDANVVITGSQIRKSKNSGIHLEGDTYSTSLGVFSTLIVDNDYGIEIASHSSVIVEGNTFHNKKGDIVSVNTDTIVLKLIVTGNIFTVGFSDSPSNTRSIHLKQTNYPAIITNNYFEIAASGLVDYYIYIEGTTWHDYFVIIGNTFEDKPTNGYIYLSHPNNSIVKYNGGFVTENSGSATIPNGGTSVTVNHGLAGAPTNIVLTGTHSEVKDAYVQNVTSTSFDIVVDSAVSADRTVYWRAEYRP